MLRDWSTDSDGVLLRKAARHSDAFGELYLRYEAIVASYIMRRTRDLEQTADLTSETFATALVHAGRFKDDGGPAIGWLLAIARHTLLQTWERGRTERRALDRLGADRLEISDASYERAEALIDSDRPDNPLFRALDRLPPDQREAVRAYVLDERTYEELALDLNVPSATVRQRVSRGMTRLRTNLEGRYR